MSPILPPGMVSLGLGLFAIAVIALAILGIFKGNIYNRLSTRIIALIFASGLVAIIIFSVLGESLFSTQHPFRWHLVQTALIVLGGPVALGLLATRFVQRPLRQFNNAIASLEESNYKIQLRLTGIREFDEVFTKFNNLILRLRSEEKLRKDLVSDTSHELNTPLTAMIGQLTAIQEGKYPATKQRIAILQEQAERLAELVQQLDAYTKARIPDVQKLENVPLKQFCQRLIDHFSVELKEREMTAIVHIADEVIIHANRDALQRILTNFVQNALRYSEATELTITGTDHQLIFSDNGKGVPADSLPYLFERFYRVDKSRNRTTGGLGLGLAIVRELAEGQGWSVHAKIAHPGLTFTLDIN
jgi:two-component system sensor histidine kinase BaeS